MSPTLLGLHHVQLAMPEGEEAAGRAFYGELLGLPETPKPPALAARGGLWFEQGELRLHLGVEKAFHPAQKAHPALLVDDLAALRARLEAAGVRIREDQPLEGFVRCYATDPFGNRLELMQCLAPEPGR